MPQFDFANEAHVVETIRQYGPNGIRQLGFDMRRVDGNECIVRNVSWNELVAAAEYNAERVAEEIKVDCAQCDVLRWQ